MTNLLERVAQHRDAILLAEIGALIHDLGKLSAEFIRNISTNAADWHYAVLQLHNRCLLESIVADFENSSLSTYDFVNSRITETQLAECIQLLWDKLRQDKIEKAKRMLEREFDKTKDVARKLARQGQPRDKIELYKKQADDEILARVEQVLREVQSQDFHGIESKKQELELLLTEALANTTEKEKVEEIVRPIQEHYRRLRVEKEVVADFLLDDFAELLYELEITICNYDNVRLSNFLEMHHEYHGNIPSLLYHLIAQPYKGVDGFDSWLDKGQVEGQPSQNPDNTFTSTAFGYECVINVGRLKWVRHAYANILAGVLQEYQAAKVQDVPLDLQLWETWLYGDNDNGLRAKTRQAFLHALGETRRAANDVTLWDHSYSVSSLYKSALAKVLIDGWKDPANIKWCILRVNMDELALYAKAHKVADLLAYRQARDAALDAVKRLVEVEYPLGNEVYRDTSGIYFTFPDVELPEELRRRIVGTVQEIEQELTPIVKVSSAEREGLKDLLAGELKRAETDLKQPTRTDNVYTGWQQRWNNLPPGKFEICPICRIRPKREKDDECEDCYKRRKSRVADWREKPQSTIWIDEVADHNGQVAVLGGRFDLTEWLNGDMIQTMLVNADEQTPKNPSPARIRRVWETTLRFWEDAVSKTLAGYDYGRDTKRAALRQQRWVVMPKDLTIERGKVYDGTVNGKPLSLFGEGMQLRTISNLQMCGVQVPGDLDRACFDSKNETFTISAMNYEDKLSSYRPYIVLIQSPDQFIALVPACDAMGLAQELYERYTEQFGKVRNRLPLHLGLVYFKRKMPLYAALDAARRMLKVDQSGEQSIQTWQIDRARKLCNHRVLYFDNGAVWKIDEKMGDRSRDDDWYPYWQVVTASEGQTLNKKHFRVGTEDWVHMSELQKGDEVAVYPSHFSFLYLDASTRRFAAGDAEYTLLLDDVPWLTKTWKTLTAKLTATQLHALETLLKTKWEMWQLDDQEHELYEKRQETFAQLTKTELIRAKIDDAVTVDDVVSGRFFRLVELYLHIVKDEPKGENEDE